MTESIQLKITHLDEYKALYPLFQDEEIVRYTNFQKYDHIENFKSFLSKFLLIGKGEPIQFGPYSIYQNNQLIGLCGMQQINLDKGISELWYLLNVSSWGKGIAKKTVEMLILKGKENQKLKSIYAEALSINIASWKVLKHVGFEEIEEIKNGFKKGIIIEDLKKYKLNLSD